ncbi:MAG: ATP-dependent helicase [Betaproteobacteria bacterium]|nr:ATP-dependent helicase [Betaproteobacteria bacterium]
MLDRLPDYEALLYQKGYLDYSGILKEAVEQLRHNVQLRARLTEKIRHVIVDEYQDVNPIQEAVVRTLHDLGAGICVVGDDDQTIYQWRGSDVQNILNFSARYPAVQQVKLEENFRSSEGVVTVAREFIKQLVRRLPKEMKATQAQDYEAGDIVAMTFDAPEDEAEYIAQTCQALRGVAFRDGNDQRGMSWSDMGHLAAIGPPRRRCHNGGTRLCWHSVCDHGHGQPVPKARSRGRAADVLFPRWRDHRTGARSFLAGRRFGHRCLRLASSD